MSDRREETLEWLEGLQEFVENHTYPTRILDGISEIRQDIGLHKSWDEIETSIDVLLHSIVNNTKTQDVDHSGISHEAIKNEIGKSLNKCRERSKEVILTQKSVKEFQIRSFLAQMHDLIHTKAYVKDLKREMFIDEYVDRNARGFRIGILENFRETFKGVSVNYEQAFREIKNILGNFCIEKTYFEYLEKLDQLGKKTQREIETVDVGFAEINALKQELYKRWKQIYGKIKRKKIVLYMAPFLIGALLLAIRGILQMLGGGEATQASSGERKGFNLGEKLLEFLSGFDLKELRDLFGRFLSTSVGLLIIAVVILGTLLILYICLIRKEMDKQLCRRCAVAFQKELDCFEQSRCLDGKLEAEMLDVMNVYDRSFVDTILNPLLMENNYLKSLDSVEQLSKLKQEWDNRK